MTPSSERSLPQTAPREGGWKTLLITSIVFLAVAGASFAYMRFSPAAADAKVPAAKTNVAKDPDPTAAEMAKESAPIEAQRECLLENVGSVSCIYLYQSYLNIGLLADAVENQTYTKENAAQLLATTTTLVQTVDGQMAKLERVGLEKEEVDSIQHIRAISKLLKAQTDHLQKHWQTADSASLDAFRQARQSSWRELRDILGLSDPEK